MVKHPFKIHVWGAINFKGKVGLYVFTENLDRHLYRQILNEQLYDNADVLVVVGGSFSKTMTLNIRLGMSKMI
jgi:hypothetical protein